MSKFFKVLIVFALVLAAVTHGRQHQREND